MVTCYAGPNEPLEVHLVEVAQCVAREGELAAKKLAREFGIAPEEALDLLVFAALMHDAGKADRAYAGEGGYYPHHEVRSAALAYAALRRLGLVESCDLANGEGWPYKAALATVALHHYVHKDLRKDVALGYEPRCGDVVVALRKWEPHSALGAKMREAAIAVASAPAEPYPCYTTIINSASRANTRHKAAISAILGILNKCDAEVAEKNRNASNPSLF